MKEFFESEMQDFATAASGFARAYPEQAALLDLESLTDRDPYVERLFEGMAFLTAGIRKQLHQGVPELASQLLQQMAPALGRAYPSSSVVEFSLPDDSVGVVTVPKGQRVTARNVGPDQTACHFTTVREQVVRPLRVTHFERKESKSSQSSLSIRFEKSVPHAWQNIALQRLPIYLNSDRSQVYRLWQLLTHGKTTCTVQQGDEGVSGRVRFVPQALAETSGMLPETGRDVAAYSLPLDYFCGRDFFFYVELEGLAQIDWQDDANYFTVQVDSELKLPVSHSVDASQLMLNTVPVINLFAAEAEPVRFDHTRSDYPLYPDTTYLGHMQIHSVDRVTGRNLHTGVERHYQHLHARHYQRGHENVFYTTHDRKPSGEEVTRLVLHQAGQPVSEIVSVGVTATNGHYARQHLGVGSLQEVRVEGCPALAVRNITRPTSPCRAPESGGPEWRWIATMASNISNFADHGQLQQVLGLYDWSGDSANRRRIESLVSFSKVLQHRIHKGALCRQWAVDLTLRKDAFDSEADAGLFGFMIHQLMTALAPVGEKVDTRLVLLPDYEEMRWKPTP
ncbi:MAG: type VI secretion system baseplate subunit TssF [Natronospirillum sp.]